MVSCKSVVASLWFLAIFSTVLNAAVPPDAEELRDGERAGCEIRGVRVDAYRMTLGEGQSAHIDVDQHGIDVVVRVADDANNVLIEADDDSRPEGEEHVVIAASSNATYQVTVKPRYPRAPAGNYVLTTTIVATTDTDRSVYDATVQVTKWLILRGTGKMEEARNAAARAVDIAEQAFGADSVFTATTRVRLGYAERELGHQTIAREAFERALAVDDASFGREHPLSARTLDYIGLTYLSEDEFAKADRAFTEAQAIIERVLGPDHPWILNSLLHTSLLHDEMEDHTRAIAELQRARTISEKYLDPDDFQITTIIGNLGSYYEANLDYDHAEPLLRETLQRIEKKFGGDHPYAAIPLMELGIVTRERRRYDEALEVLWRAEAIREKAFGYRNPQTAAILIVLGNVLDARDQHEQALALKLAALDTLESTVGPYHNLVMTCLSALTRTYAALGDISCAIDNQRELDERLDKALAYNLEIGSERQKLAYAESTADRTDRTVSLHVRNAPDDPIAAQNALRVVLQRKGRVLDAMGQNFATLRRGLSVQDQSLLDHLRDTNAELARVALAGPGKTAIASYTAKLNKLESGKESLEARISAHSSAFRAQYRPVTVRAVRDSIPRDAALIEFLAYRPFDPIASSDRIAYGDPRYVAYVVRRTGRIAFRDLGSSKEIDALVASWRESLRDPQRTDTDDLARKLDRLVVRPLVPLVGNAVHLLVAPDGQLGLVPFEALVDARGRHRIERYQFSYLTSGRDLLSMDVRRPPGAPPVIVADPQFGEPAYDRTASTVYFTPLVATRQEAQSIHALFPDARILAGREASKETLEHLDSPRILHIATHGFFLDTTAREHRAIADATRSVSAVVATPNPLLRSGLALSGANLASRGNNDGVLTALEASTLNLWGTRLVTLSACDSGVGEVKDREGVYGLRRAFTLAGAETVVMSLWPVSDYYTRRIMTSFYRGLAGGRGRGDALRQAQLAMMKSKPHPFYWASFIESGNWRPLR